MTDYTENYPLHLAVQDRDAERVKELLRSGAKADSRDKLNVTPLMVAARNGFDELVELLIAAGADVNARDRASRLHGGRQTALYHACDEGRVRTARLLLMRGADPDCADQNLRTPFSNALASTEEDLAELLLEFGAAPDGPPECFEPPVVAAAGDGYLKMVKRLLALGADPNRMGKSGENALGCTPSVECARELLGRGADVNLRNASGQTPLLERLRSGSLQLITCLVEAGADVNAADRFKITVLMNLTNRPDIGMADLLIKAGADFNALPVPTVSVLDHILMDTSCNYVDARKRLVEFLKSKGAKTARELNPGAFAKAKRKKVSDKNRIAPSS